MDITDDEPTVDGGCVMCMRKLRVTPAQEVQAVSGAWSQSSGSGNSVGASARRRSVASSVYSMTPSHMEARLATKAVLKESRWPQFGRMLIVLALPLMVLLVMAGLSVYTQVSQNIRTAQLHGIEDHVARLDRVALALRSERNSAVKHLQRSVSNVQDVDDTKGTVNVSDILPELEMETLLKLRQLRSSVNNKLLTVEECILKFNNLTHVAMKLGLNKLQTEIMGTMNLWNKVLAINGIFILESALDIRNQMIWHKKCDSLQEKPVWLHQLDGEINTGLFVIKSNFKRSIEYINGSLNFYLAKTTEDFLTPRYCNNVSTTANLSPLTLLDVPGVALNDMRQAIFGDIELIRNKITFSQTSTFVITCTSIICVLCLCAAMAVWYVGNVNKMLKHLAKCLETMMTKTKGLKREKRRAEMIINQMLPKSVAQDLQLGLTVRAEYYDDVSVYFSDIAKFHYISSQSTPIQVIRLLNYVYSRMDTCIEKYEVYKVETIGAAYMVAAGVPNRIDNHCFELASMAIDLLNMSRGLKLRHLPGEMLLLRAGIHTGSCVSGVLGTRMPRYCLFGDTINTAARMQTHGEVSRIHMSGYSATRLRQWGSSQFKLEERGDVFIKGKGTMKTFWLSSNLSTSNADSTKKHNNDTGLMSTIPSLLNKSPRFNTSASFSTIMTDEAITQVKPCEALVDIETLSEVDYSHDPSSEDETEGIY